MNNDMTTAQISTFECRQALGALYIDGPMTTEEFLGMVGWDTARQLLLAGLIEALPNPAGSDQIWLTPHGVSFMQGRTREHPVPCSRCGLPTWHTSARCERHL